MMLSLALVLAAPTAEVRLPAGPGPVTNPLKGFAPYVLETEPQIKDVPYTLGYHYATWKDLEPTEGQYAFDKWEAGTIRTGLSKGRRMVVRVQMDYPSRPPGVPQWLIDKGVKMTPYKDHGGGQSPDYEDPRLRASLKKLIAEMGKRWNNNPQIAYVQMGLLGHWGEWHTWPREDLFPSDAVQKEVVDAMRAAFPNKHILARTANGYLGKQPWLGYHDDMIPQDTMGNEDWYFLPNLKLAGRDNNWKTAPVGGEMVPFASVQYLGKDWDQTLRAVKEAHLSWIGPYCPLLENPNDPVYRQRVAELSQKLGYEFRLDTVKAQTVGKTLGVTVKGVNQGVAPFYYKWPVRLVLLDAKNKVVSQADSPADLRKWLPGSFSLTASLPKPARKGTYRLAIGLIDPWMTRPTVRFANRLSVVDGWTVLQSVSF